MVRDSPGKVRATLAFHVIAVSYIDHTAERVPSVDLLLEIIRDERDKQLTHFDALDSKAGIVLGFSGVLIALSPELPIWSPMPGILLALIAAAGGLAAFWPRAMPVLRPTQLRKYLTSEEQFTRLTVLDTLELMVNEGGWVLQQKARRLKVSLSALAVAASIYGLGAIAV